VASDREQAQHTLYLLHDGWHRQTELFDSSSGSPDGSFIFKDVAPGEYVLALNPLGPRLFAGSPAFPTTFYPGVPDLAAATRLTVTAGQVLDVGEFVAPPVLPPFRVEGQVLGQDGAPVGKATVDASHRGSASFFVTTDENGRFALSVPEGTYARLRVFAPGDGPRTEIPFHAAPGLAPLRIVLSPGRTEVATSSDDAIEIVRIEPPEGSLLHPGDDVRMRVTVRHQLASAVIASLSLVVQDDTGNHLVLPQPTVDVPRGSGELTLEARVRIPEKSTFVRVFTPLRLSLAREVPLVDRVQYMVVH
jgi:hypothetical protein